MKARTLFLALVFASASALAQPQETFSNQEARARFEEGIKLADANDYERARVKFLQAYALEQRPSILINLAVCEQKTNRLLEAIEHASEYLQNPKPDPKRAEYARQLLAELARATGKIAFEAPAGLVIVVDGKSKGQTPNPGVYVMPGTHKVTVGDKTTDITCVAGETQTMKVESGSNHAPDGAPPPTMIDRTETRWMPPPAGAIVLGGVGVVGLGVGVGLGAVSSGQRSDLDAKAKATGGVCNQAPQTPACADLKSARDSNQSTATVAAVSYVAGGALVLAGVVWWLVAPRKVTERVPVSPSVGAGYVGVSTSMSF